MNEFFIRVSVFIIGVFVGGFIMARFTLLAQWVTLKRLNRGITKFLKK